MSLNNYNTGKQYTKYKRHSNHSNEVIKAESVNKIQDDINAQQKETNEIINYAFEERVYTIFNNNLYTNAMFIDPFRNGEFINMNRSNGMLMDYETGILTLDKNNDHGFMTSSTVYSIHGADVKMNDFFLIANADVPSGASIKYYIQNARNERFPIQPNTLKLPMHLKEELEAGFNVVIEMQANGVGEKPQLHGYAVIFWDAAVEADYGITDPDLQRFP